MVDPRTGRAFVVSYAGRVSVLDAEGANHGTAVMLGADPQSAVFDATRGRAIVCSTVTNLLSVLDLLDTRRMQVIRRIPVGGTCSTELAVDVQRGRTYAPVGPVVYILATDTGALLRTVPLSGRVQAAAVAVDPRTGDAFVTGGYNTVSILARRSASLVRTITVGQAPGPVAVDASRSRVFVVNQNGDSVSTLDARTGTVLRTAPVGMLPMALAVDERRGRVFVLGGGSVSTLDAATGVVVATTPVGGTPIALAVDTGTGRVFVTGTAAGGGAPSRPRSSFLDRLIVWVVGVVPHQDAGHVSVLDARSGALLYTAAVGQGPSAVAMSERTHQAFIANFNSNSVSVLDANR